MSDKYNKCVMYNKCVKYNKCVTRTYNKCVGHDWPDMHLFTASYTIKHLQPLLNLVTSIFAIQTNSCKNINNYLDQINFHVSNCWITKYSTCLEKMAVFWAIELK